MKKGIWGELWGEIRAGFLGQESPSHKAWITTQGKILSSRVDPRKRGTTSMVSGTNYYHIYHPLIFYSYRAADGRQYEGTAVFQDIGKIKEAQEWVQHNPPGMEIAVIYDPERPEDSALPGNPSGKETALGSLAIETSTMCPQYQGPETDYVRQLYALHDPAYWGSLSADNGILTCVGCSKTKPLGSCPNCGYEQQFFRTEADENWDPDSSLGRGFTPLKGVEGYVRCHSCGNAWHWWTCECGTRNNIRQSLGWKDHIIVESGIPWLVDKTTKPPKEQ